MFLTYRGGVLTTDRPLVWKISNGEISLQRSPDPFHVLFSQETVRDYLSTRVDLFPMTLSAPHPHKDHCRRKKFVEVQCITHGYTELKTTVALGSCELLYAVYKAKARVKASSWYSQQHLQRTAWHHSARCKHSRLWRRSVDRYVFGIMWLFNFLLFGLFSCGITWTMQWKQLMAN